jgi:hypothetical protein
VRLILCIWIERNDRSSKDSERMLVELKALFFKNLLPLDGLPMIISLFLVFVAFFIFYLFLVSYFSCILHLWVALLYVLMNFTYIKKKKIFCNFRHLFLPMNWTMPFIAFTVNLLLFFFFF